MTRVIPCLVGLCGIAACAQSSNKAAAAASASAPGPAPQIEPACVLPQHASQVVIEISRHVVPIGNIRVEKGQITASGVCTPKIACIRASDEEVHALANRIASLGELHFRSHATSPHYGGRFIELAWAGGKCNYSDTSSNPLLDKDLEKFGLVYDAIAVAFTKAPDRMDASP